ncbi:uncharacterized protein conserved in bacteria [Hahella chejuensis KCTC 2396]|uniref:Uncharacterized protein conserved in bacteria n=1 Tax=Hahella chejuensis (strain KCTC 2396) TaxID=349521 RepID=Q2S7L2_HAHCH|nr:cupredoxin domain-containing protein [Hahella chejuensis]ABC33362.1 uncharacterized protein conserved in bacteria [Hahella chejuensis KCTC 2396]
MTILVNLLGLGAMAFVIYWFWLWRPQNAARSAGGAIEITVSDGVYSPSHIEIPAGESATLRFLRKDPSPCAAMVIFDGLNISEELPVGQAKDIRIQAQEKGVYKFNCQMNMYQGSLKVV